MHSDQRGKERPPLEGGGQELQPQGPEGCHSTLPSSTPWPQGWTAPPRVSGPTDPAEKWEERSGMAQLDVVSLAYVCVVAGEGTQQSWNEREPRWHEVSPSSVGSRKDPDRIIPLGLSARDRVLPIWEPLYSSKAASWVGMLLERATLGVAAVGLTGRTEGRGRGGRGGREKSRVISSPAPWGMGHQEQERQRVRGRGVGGAGSVRAAGVRGGVSPGEIEPYRRRTLLSGTKSALSILKTFPQPRLPGVVTLEGYGWGPGSFLKPSHHLDVPVKEGCVVLQNTTGSLGGLRTQTKTQS